jgi:hypothetical protein
MQQPGRFDVVDKPAAPAQQERILDAGDATPDQA